MDREKWCNIELAILSEYFKYAGAASPESWEERRELFLGYVKEIDELQEVYNMENKKK